jgi:hypothetical protein
MADNGHKPTSGMKSAAARALAWHKEGKRGGTSVGYARANQIVNGESLSDDTVKRMYSFFSRHEVDKKATGFNSGEEGYPSPGRVAWDLWGGDSGFAFARSKVKHTIKKMIEDEMQEVLEKSKKSISVGQMVSWGSSGGSAKGKVVKIKRKGSIKVPDSSFTITGTKDNPAVLIRVYKDGKPTDTLVGHKMNTLNSIKKDIGNNSSLANDPIKEPMPEEYTRKSEGGEKNMSENIEKTTTEPDPKGDIAVLKSVDSDLARRKITKAIKSLEKALTTIPDTSRAASVSVDNATAPVAKAVDGKDVDAKDVPPAQAKKLAKYLAKASKAIEKAATSIPNAGRAANVSVDNSITKDVGDANDVKGDGDNSKPGNPTVSTDAKPMTKGSCGPDCTGDGCTKCAAMGMTKAACDCCDNCGANCTGSCCEKCASMNKEASTSSTAPSAPVAMAADAEDIKKSVWGGAFSATTQASIGVARN